MTFSFLITKFALLLLLCCSVSGASAAHRFSRTAEDGLGDVIAKTFGGASSTRSSSHRHVSPMQDEDRIAKTAEDGLGAVLGPSRRQVLAGGSGTPREPPGHDGPSLRGDPLFSPSAVAATVRSSYTSGENPEASHWTGAAPTTFRPPPARRGWTRADTELLLASANGGEPPRSSSSLVGTTPRAPRCSVTGTPRKNSLDQTPRNSVDQTPRNSVDQPSTPQVTPRNSVDSSTPLSNRRLELAPLPAGASSSLGQTTAPSFRRSQTTGSGGDPDHSFRRSNNQRVVQIPGSCLWVAGDDPALVPGGLATTARRAGGVMPDEQTAILQRQDSLEARVRPPPNEEHQRGPEARRSSPTIGSLAQNETMNDVAWSGTMSPSSHAPAQEPHLHAGGASCHNVEESGVITKRFSLVNLLS